MVVTYQRTQDDTGGVPVLIVKLDSGRQVRATATDNVPVRYGARVTLTEIVTRLFGVRRYRFVRYNQNVEQNAALDAQKDARQ